LRWPLVPLRRRRRKKAKVVVPERDLVAEVRASGVEAEDALDVQPLRDPAIADLRAAATDHERARRFEQADASLDAALKLSPADPELWQLRAEMALYREDFEAAEQFASSSFARGPKLGGLCRRNWTTVRLAREMRGRCGRRSQCRCAVDALHG
jgi:tetratricopeptide (TPR) repeat protein